MLKNIKKTIFALYGLTFFITLFLSSIFPITATLSVVFSAIGQHAKIIATIMKFSKASLMLHILWWLIALFASTVNSLIIKPNINFAIISGILYTIVSILSICACALLYRNGIY